MDSPYQSDVNLQPLLDAPLSIQLHFVTVVPAFFIPLFSSFSLGAGPIIAGLLTFIPGRVMYRMFFG